MWTGEYPPYTSERFPSGGPVSVIVARALKMVNLETELKFGGWAEVPSNLETGNSIAFPYAKNSERLSRYAYSDVIFSGRSRFFTLYDQPASLFKNKKHWTGKTYCRPLGWDQESIEVRYKEFNFKVLQVKEMEYCFKLLKERRVDLVPAAESLGWATVHRLFESTHGIQTLDDVADRFDLHVIISKANPKSRPILDALNRGLRQLKTSGEYKRLLEASKLSVEAPGSSLEKSLKKN